MISSKIGATVIAVAAPRQWSGLTPAEARWGSRHSGWSNAAIATGIGTRFALAAAAAIQRALLLGVRLGAGRGGGVRPGWRRDLRCSAPPRHGHRGHALRVRRPGARRRGSSAHTTPRP